MGDGLEGAGRRRSGGGEEGKVESVVRVGSGSAESRKKERGRRGVGKMVVSSSSRVRRNRRRKQELDSPLSSSVVSLELSSNRLNESSLILIGDSLPLSDPLLDVGGGETDRVEVLVGDGEGDQRLQGRETERRGSGEKVVQVGEAGIADRRRWKSALKKKRGR